MAEICKQIGNNYFTREHFVTEKRLIFYSWSKMVEGENE